MNGAPTEGSVDLLDAVLDLQHDLGKYIAMPMLWLEDDAGPDRVREALDTALRRTRVNPGGTRSAREIWEQFRGEFENTLRDLPEFATLGAAVDRALAWERTLDEGAAIDAAKARDDLSAVGNAIRILARRLKGA